MLAERIRSKIASTAFAVSEEKNIRLTCSLGFASWPLFNSEPDALGWQEILSLADRCLYLAKNSGRNAWTGIVGRPDYKGSITTEALNDLWEAEEQGIIDILSFTTSDEKPQQYPPASAEGQGKATPMDPPAIKLMSKPQ